MFGALRAYRPFFGVMLIVAMLQSCSTIPDTYTAEPIRGKVIDAETKLPLEGVNVLAYWPTYTGSHEHYEGSIEIKEAVTDAKGEYLIPGWGPKKNPNPGWLRKRNAPIMLFFKPWYGPQNYFNGVEKSLSNPEYVGPHLQAEMNGRTVELTLDTSIDDLANSFRHVYGEIHRFVSGDQCEWAFLPKAIAAVDVIWSELDKNRARVAYLTGTLAETLRTHSEFNKHCKINVETFLEQSK